MGGEGTVGLDNADKVKKILMLGMVGKEDKAPLDLKLH